MANATCTTECETCGLHPLCAFDCPNNCKCTCHPENERLLLTCTQCHQKVRQTNGGGVCPACDSHARLIAAAPDLLEACKRMLPVMDRASGSNLNKVITFAKIAIAKAEGRA